MFPERKKQSETNKHPGFLPGDAFCPKHRRGAQAGHGGFAESRRQRLDYWKLMQWEFDGQRIATDKTTDGRSCRNMHRCSQVFSSIYSRA